MFVIYFDLLLRAHYESALPATIHLAPKFQMKECPLLMWQPYIQMMNSSHISISPFMLIAQIL
jgi:hypothetical protein